MEKPVEIHPDGTAVVKMGFDNSVDARNFLAQIAHLVSYRGARSRRITFRIDRKSIRQAAEWGLKKKAVKQRLRELCPNLPYNISHYFWDRAWKKAKSKQTPGRYSRWLTYQQPRPFWTRLRAVQTLWVLRGFGKTIVRSNLPGGFKNFLDHYHQGSWPELVRLAGFDPEEEFRSLPQEKWSKRKVVQRLREMKRKGLPINQSRLVKDGHSNLAAAMRRQFGSWEAAIKAAGLKPDEEWRGWLKKIFPREVVRRLQRRYRNREKMTRTGTLHEDSNLVYSAEFHFGSWESALATAGINPSEVQPILWTKESVVESLRGLKALGEPINAKWIKAHHKKLYWAILRHFGCCRDALEAAGFDPDQESLRERWNRDKVLRELLRLKSTWEPLNPAHLRDNHVKLYHALRDFFSSWSEAMEEIGLVPENESLLPSRLKKEGSNG